MRRILAFNLIGVFAAGGCATVNPRPDYERVGRQITEATGQEQVYQPEEDELVQERVAELLGNGLTADEAVNVCLLNNPELQAAFLDVGMARADFVQAGLFSNPFLGISAKLPDGGGLANLDIGIAQNIAELWQIPIRKRAAEQSLDRAILVLAGAAVDLAADAKRTYYAAIGAEQRHAIAKENLTIAQGLLDIALARQEAGASGELYVNLSRSVAVDAEIEVERTRLASADARRALATILGLVMDAEAMVLTDSLPDDYPDIADAGLLVALARNCRLDMRVAEDAIALAETQLEEQLSLVFPTVEVGLAFERDERRSEGGRNVLADTARASVANGGLTAPEIQPRSQRDSGQDTILGPSLGVELPIFDQNQAQIAKAQYAVQQAQKTLDAVDRSLTHEVRGAVDRALTTWRLLKKYKDQSVPLAQRNLELSREAYRVGRASFLSVLEAQRFFLEARRGYVGAAQSAATAVPDLERTIGLPFQKLFDGVHADALPERGAQEHAEP